MMPIARAVEVDLMVDARTNSSFLTIVKT